MSDKDDASDHNPLTSLSAEVPDPFHGPDWEGAAVRRRTSSGPSTRRRRRSRRRRRRIVIGGGVVALAVGAALAWLAYTALKARSELEHVQADVHTLRGQIAAGDVTAARSTALSLRQHAERAHDLTTGPIWATAAAVPYLGDPLDTARVLSVNVERISAQALPPLIDASQSLDPKTLREPDGVVSLKPIQRVAPLLTSSLRVMKSAVTDLSSSSGSTWLGSANSARQDLLDQLPPLIRTVQNADTAAHTIPALLGANGPKNYLVSFQNEAELRGLGGLPGAFAILEADNGKLHFSNFEADGTLSGVPASVDLGSDYHQLYGPIQFPNTLYADSNLSPHFPYAAKVWTALWQAKTGQHLDGAITLDPTAISYLLAVTGPAQMPDGSEVSAANVVSLTQQTAYDRFAKDNDKRKRFLLDLARAVSNTLVGSHGDATALVKAAARGADEHRLLVWTDDNTVENQLASTPIAGQVPETSAPYAGLAINNEGVNKLDYYLHASVDRSSVGCGSLRDVTVTIKLTNEAPGGLPDYVSGALNRKPLPPGGTNRSDVFFYATQGSSFTSVTVNGKRSAAISGVERGHPAFGVTVDSPRNHTEIIVFRIQEPAAMGALTTRMQPMINPVVLATHNAICRS